MRSSPSLWVSHAALLGSGTEDTAGNSKKAQKQLLFNCVGCKGEALPEKWLQELQPNLWVTGQCFYWRSAARRKNSASWRAGEMETGTHLDDREKGGATGPGGTK